jgi:hypothetical protein
MKIEVGKYYRTRDGRKVGPMEKWSNSAPHCWRQVGRSIFYNEGGDIWDDNGGSEYFGEHGHLIAEWTDEPASPTLSGETIDHIAIDSLKFHIQDKDMDPLQYEAFRVVLRYYGVVV